MEGADALESKRPMQLRTILLILFLLGSTLWKCTRGWPLGGGILHHQELAEGREILIEEEWRSWILHNGYSTRIWYRTGPEELWANYWIHFDDQKRWTEPPEVRWSWSENVIVLQVFYKGQRRGFFNLRVPAEKSSFRNILDFDLDPNDQPGWPTDS